MGYSHYWTNRAFTDAEWTQMRAAAKRIQARAIIEGGIRLGDGLGDGLPLIDGDEIALNGRKPESYETFRIERGAGKDSCKTEHRPYDAVVVALLIVGARIGALSWSSDGDDSDHEAGTLLARDLP